MVAFQKPINYLEKPNWAENLLKKNTRLRGKKLVLCNQFLSNNKQTKYESHIRFDFNKGKQANKQAKIRIANIKHTKHTHNTTYKHIWN